MPLIVRCARCGKEKSIKPSQKKERNFCSRECLNAFKRMSLVCKGCNKVFTIKLSDQHKNLQYCTVDCRVTDNSIHIDCETCGKNFRITKYDYEVRKLRRCSRECRKHAHTCSNCGNIFNAKNSTRQGNNVYCSVKCLHQDRVGEKHPLWRGGKHIDQDGYVAVYIKESQSYTAEHILVMENHLGRELEHDEVVHHINLDKKDNRIENLVVLKRDEHSRLHRLLDSLIREKLRDQVVELYIQYTPYLIQQIRGENGYGKWHKRKFETKPVSKNI